MYYYFSPSKEPHYDTVTEPEAPQPRWITVPILHLAYTSPCPDLLNIEVRQPCSRAKFSLLCAKLIYVYAKTYTYGFFLGGVVEFSHFFCCCFFVVVGPFLAQN